MRFVSKWASYIPPQHGFKSNWQHENVDILTYEWLTFSLSNWGRVFTGYMALKCSKIRFWLCWRKRENKKLIQTKSGVVICMLYFVCLWSCPSWYVNLFTLFLGRLRIPKQSESELFAGDSSKWQLFTRTMKISLWLSPWMLYGQIGANSWIRTVYRWYANGQSFTAPGLKSILVSIYTFCISLSWGLCAVVRVSKSKVW